jgi:peptide/nickel transport system permease protein
MKFAAQRLASSILVLLVTSSVSFFALVLGPGDFLSDARMESHVPAATVQTMESQFGLNLPAFERYLLWLSNALQGNLGQSFATGTPVAQLLWERGSGTLILVAQAQALSWILAVALALWGARRSGKLFHSLLAPIAYTILSIPEVVLVLAIALLFANVGVEFSRGVAPVLALTLTIAPAIWLQVSSAFKRASGLSFVQAAVERGFPEKVVLLRYLLPAASPTCTALVGLSIGSSLSTSLLVECALGYPGLGPLLLDAILSRDVNVALGAVLAATLMWTMGNLAAELLQLATDPKLRSAA